MNTDEAALELCWEARYIPWEVVLATRMEAQHHQLVFRGPQQALDLSRLRRTSSWTPA